MSDYTDNSGTDSSGLTVQDAEYFKNAFEDCEAELKETVHKLNKAESMIIDYDLKLKAAESRLSRARELVSGRLALSPLIGKEGSDYRTKELLMILKAIDVEGQVKVLHKIEEDPNLPEAPPPEWDRDVEIHGRCSDCGGTRVDHEKPGWACTMYWERGPEERLLCFKRQVTNDDLCSHCGLNVNEHRLHDLACMRKCGICDKRNIPFRVDWEWWQNGYPIHYNCMRDYFAGRATAAVQEGQHSRPLSESEQQSLDDALKRSATLRSDGRLKEKRDAAWDAKTKHDHSDGDRKGCTDPDCDEYAMNEYPERRATSMRCVKREIIEDHGDYVTIVEYLEPHPDGPFIVFTPIDQDEPIWAKRRSQVLKEIVSEDHGYD